MKCIAILALTLGFTSVLPAAEHGQLIFHDDFNRHESQEKPGEPGNGWGTNSKSRPRGDKQVDLKDGGMRIKTPSNRKVVQFLSIGSVICLVCCGLPWLLTVQK